MCSILSEMKSCTIVDEHTFHYQFPATTFLTFIIIGSIFTLSGVFHGEFLLVIKGKLCFLSGCYFCHIPIKARSFPICKKC